MDQHPGDPQEPLPSMSERCLETNFSPELEDYLERARAAKQAYMEAWERGENPPMWRALLPRDYLTLLKPEDEQTRARKLAGSMEGSRRLLRNPLNQVATRLLKSHGIVVFARTLPLSQAILEGLNHWEPKGEHGPQTFHFLANLGEAETPQEFVDSLLPFICPLAWDQDQAKRLGLLPYGQRSLDQYTPARLVVEAGECRDFSELLDLLERQSTWASELLS